ncbi:MULTISPECIES: hypothetical protein [Actinoalloteichus]|uniref:Uncharacterized protein n=1 Tax=Actinoalloteichus fjordicus TaxID=1612552 RepID=A0AAC9LDS7_9PSEU|nr:MULTISPECIES: hypothetical protein [Actinoalloteichus]APU15796.1 hypothetical protein UA74_18840 [Actinoalloteichus fjordicus]APU21856.1 hypothetical protein UA75_19330 [Actinoalloteichus sp. GBA129-24]
MIYHDASYAVPISATLVGPSARSQALIVTIDRVQGRVLLQLGGRTARGLAALEPQQAETLRRVLNAPQAISRLLPALGPGLTIRVLWVRTSAEAVELSLSGRGALTDAWRLRPAQARQLAASLREGIRLLCAPAEATCR